MTRPTFALATAAFLGLLALTASPVAAEPIDITTGEPGDPCGIFQQPCWTARYVCFMVGPAVNPPWIDRLTCETQPDADAEDALLRVG